MVRFNSWLGSVVQQINMITDRKIYDFLVRSSKHPAVCQKLVDLGVPVDLARQLADTGKYSSQTVIVSLNEKAKSLIDDLGSKRFWR